MYNDRNRRTAQQWATYFALTYTTKTREIQFPFREMDFNHAQSRGQESEVSNQHFAAGVHAIDSALQSVGQRKGYLIACNCNVGERC